VLSLCTYLNNHSPGRWIGRGGQRECAQIALVFDGCAKENIYRYNPRSLMKWNDRYETICRCHRLVNKKWCAFFPGFRIVYNILGLMLKS